MKIKFCKVCGLEYGEDESKTGYKFCSCKCSSVSAKQEYAKAEHKGICKGCGKRFVKTSSGAVYCSSECKYETRTCESCGEEYKLRIGTNNNSKFCSVKCSNDAKKKSHEEYYIEFSKIHKGKIVPITFYQSGDKELTIHCLECGKQTTRKASAFVEADKRRGCQYCVKQLSVAENVIGEWLDEHGIKYIRQHMEQGLEDKAKLRFDFAILDESENIKLLLEYNGVQHYEEVGYFGGKATHIKQMQRDELKRQYSKAKGIPLIEIHYNEQNNLNEILQTILL